MAYFFKYTSPEGAHVISEVFSTIDAAEEAAAAEVSRQGWFFVNSSDTVDYFLRDEEISPAAISQWEKDRATKGEPVEVLWFTEDCEEEFPVEIHRVL